MTKSKLIIAAAAAVLSTSAAQADVVIHITGSTAFRSGTVTAIQALMGSGNYKAAYGTTSGSGTTSSNRAVIQGNIASVPSADLVTFKCSWSGSTGGIKTTVQNLDVATWPSITNLPAVNSNTAVGFPETGPGAMSFALDTGTFPGETAKSDVTMEDTTQAATGFTTTTLTEIRVGVVPFEWVAGNGSPAALNNITPLLAQAAISGGAPVSLFTGTSDFTPVYVVGRNFDSGTRLISLTNSGLSPFAGVQHVQLTTNGTTQGTNGSAIATMRLYQFEPDVLGQEFAIGNSGYNSGSVVADFLATPGASAATATGFGAQDLSFGAGHLIGFLGRSDAARACRTRFISNNTARRMTFNGVSSIIGTALDQDGVPTGGYNNAAVTEGSYTLWEFQNLAYRQSYTGDAKLVADALAAEIIANVPVTSGLKLIDMKVTKQVEGGVVTSKRL